MPLSVKLDPISKDIDVVLAEMLSPAARSAVLADIARDALGDAEQQNFSVLGRIPPHKTFVDGAEGASEDKVRPDGTIVYEFAIVTDLFVWIATQLEQHSPKLTGRFAKSFTLFADGTEVDPGGQIPDAQEYVFLNTQPYARKIERGESPQAPDGVFEAIAALARARFGNMARIDFTFRTPISGALATGRVGNRSDARTPAIVVTVK